MESATGADEVPQVALPFTSMQVKRADVNDYQQQTGSAVPNWHIGIGVVAFSPTGVVSCGNGQTNFLRSTLCRRPPP